MSETFNSLQTKNRFRNSEINIAIIHDYQLEREYMIHLLNAQPEFSVILEAENSSELIKLIKKKSLPIEVIITFNFDMMYGETEDFVLLHELRNSLSLEEFRNVKILMILDSLQGRLIQKAYNMGVQGCLHYKCESEELFYAIMTISHGKMHYQHKVREKMEEYIQRIFIDELPHIDDLTPIEREILEMIADGFTTEEIAIRKGFALPNLAAQRNNLIKKFGAENASNLIYLAYQNGILRKK
ncbi:MAG: response regulator transcription factor [Bacteroidia bacterium]